MKPIRVLVITPQYAPDFGPSAPIYTALCEHLQRCGFEPFNLFGKGFKFTVNHIKRIVFPNQLLYRSQKTVLAAQFYTDGLEKFWTGGPAGCGNHLEIQQPALTVEQSQAGRTVADKKIYIAKLV